MKNSRKSFYFQMMRKIMMSVLRDKKKLTFYKLVKTKKLKYSMRTLTQLNKE